MRIAFIAISYISQRDGISIYIENLLVQLLREADKHRQPINIDIYVCSRSALVLRSVIEDSVYNLDGNLEATKRIDFIESPYEGMWKYIWTSYKIRNYHAYACVVMPNIQPLVFIPGRKLSIKHDLTYKIAAEYVPLFRRFYSYIVTRYRLKCDDIVASISDSTACNLRKFYGKYLRAREDLIIPNGLPLKLMSTRIPSSIAVDKKLSGTELNLLFVGRVNCLKGFDRVLEVCEALDKRAAQSDIERATLYIVGKQTRETQDLLFSKRFQNVKLIICGYIDDDALNQLYHKCAFCLFLSRSEGYGLPAIEALWLSCIPILSDIPIFQEVMVSEFPFFYGKGPEPDAVINFIFKIRTDKQYRAKMLELMELVLERHRGGYQKAAKNLLQWIGVPEYTGSVNGEAPAAN